jgi:hypothetical protein
VAALRLRRGTNACASHAVDARARFVGAGVIEIRSGELTRRFAPIDAGEEQRGGGFKNGKRSATQEVGETDEDGFFAAADCESQRFVGIEVDMEAGWAAFAVETSVDALKEGGAAGDGRGKFGHRLGIVYERGVVRSKPVQESGCESISIAIEKNPHPLTPEGAAPKLTFAADGGRGYGFFGFFGICDCVFRAFDGVVQIVFVDIDINFIGGDLVQNFEEFFRLCIDEIDAGADIFLFLDAKLHQVGSIVETSDVSVHQAVEHFAVAVRRRVLQFVLKFFQAIVGERDEKLEAVVGGFGVADFVGLHRREIVLLFELGAQISAGRKRDTAGDDGTEDAILDVHIGLLL